MAFNDNYSKGCQSCQEGKWLCIFLTYRCEANCYFCPAPFKGQDKIVTAFGNHPSTILSYLKNSAFKGISFSGGDCFLVFDRLLEWLKYFRAYLPNYYFWAYTSGMNATLQKLNLLAENGLNEIRFNIAATDYDAPHTLEMINYSTELFEHVAVEIPSIRNDYQKLVEVLPTLDQMNVEFLNLHEYILTPNNPNKSQTSIDRHVLNNTMALHYDRHSLENTERIKEFCAQHKLKIKVNNCSLHKKDAQMLARRLAMGKLFRQNHERLNENGYLETCFKYPAKLSLSELRNFIQMSDEKQLEPFYISPDDIMLNQEKESQTIAKLWFLPPMSIHEKRLLFRIELLKSENCLS